MNGLFTIGYEGTDIDAFIDTLLGNNIDLLLDIREIPLSRKKGFSKNDLRGRLEAVGIDYQHEKSLGSPKLIRDKLYADGNYPAFFVAFDGYLETQHDLLQELSEEIQGNVALMCFEKDVMVCHRRAVARVLGEINKLKPQHLKSGQQGKQHESNKKRASVYSGKSLSAA